MAQICRKVTTWITTRVLDPVDTWVNQQQQKCKPKWWKPWTWICWLVWVLVRIVIWVLREIVTPISTVTCFTITSVIYLVAAPFLVGFDALAGTATHDWFKERFYYSKVKITFVSKDGPNSDGSYSYNFSCHCKDGDITINVNAFGDVDAANQAEEICKEHCG